MENEKTVAYFRAHATRWAVRKDTGQRIQLDSAIGLKRQDKFEYDRNHVEHAVRFWFEVGAAKAMRNAILRLIPEEIKVRIIQMYKDQAKELGDGAGAAPAQASLLPDAEREHLLAEIDRLCTQLGFDQEARAAWAKEFTGGDTKAAVKKADLARLSDFVVALRKKAGAP